MLGKTNINGGTPTPPTPYEQLINYTMLYDEGDECTDVTGGWEATLQTSSSSSTPSSFTKANNYLQLSGSNDSVTAMNPINAINVTDYTRICYISEATIATSTWAKQINALSDSKNVLILPSLETITTSYNKCVLVYDISSYNGLQYPKLVINTYSSTTAKLYNLAVFKADDWQTLCTKAGITAPADLATLVADSTSLATILSVEDAVNYMIAQCTGDFMASAINSSTFLTALDSSTYKTVVQANEHWAKFLAMVA